MLMALRKRKVKRYRLVVAYKLNVAANRLSRVRKRILDVARDLRQF